MRGATGVIHQRHEVLRLPRKMHRVIDPRDICDVIYNARSNRHHPPASPNTALATKNESYRWSSWHMQRRLQCAEQQASPSSLTKYCACHEKWIVSLILVAYATSFTMRGATGITLQPHQIPCLSQKMICIIDLREIWNLHLLCAEQQASPSSLTKYCACHEKWIVSLILVTYATTFTMRGATGITLQPHQILRLPRKMNRIVDPRGICNVIYNARSNRHHPPTSPNTLPVTKNDLYHWSSRDMKPSITMRGATGITLFSRFGDTFCIENYNISRSGYLPNFHQILRLPRKMGKRLACDGGIVSLVTAALAHQVHGWNKSGLQQRRTWLRAMYAAWESGMCFKKCSEHALFCIFWLENALLATAAYNFSTSELEKVVRDRQFLTILTWKCASRHSGVQFFHIWTRKSGPRPSVSYDFDLKMCFSPQRRTIFPHRYFQKWYEHARNVCSLREWHFTWKCASRYSGVQVCMSSLNSHLRARRFTEGTFRPSPPSLTFRACGSSFYWLSRNCIFFLLTLLLCSAVSILNLPLSQPQNLNCWLSYLKP